MENKHQRLILGGGVLLLLIIIGIWTQLHRPPIADPPTWQGITPAQTTRAEVLALLGEPDNTWLCEVVYPGFAIRDYDKGCEATTDVVQYGYDNAQLPGKRYGWNEIHFNPDDTVDYILVTRWSNPHVEILSKEAFLLQYGKPEQITWSLRDSYSRGLLYCEQGLIFHAVQVRDSDSDNDIGIREAVYFAPMATDQCIEKFSNEITTTDPNEGGHIESALDSWGFTRTKP